MAHGEENRSSALTPEEMGAINMATSAAVREAAASSAAAQAAMVKEAVAAVFANLGPLLQSLALTPEKLRDAMKPYKDPAVIEREIREMLLWKEDEAANRKITEDRQNNCLHIYENNRSSLQLVHNFPDNQPRGLCVLCQCLVHPREWRIGAPSKAFPRGEPYLTTMHKNYLTVVQLQAKS